MANSPDPPPGLHWHQALAYAVLGRVDPSLGTQDRPDPPGLVRALVDGHPDGRAGLLADVHQVRGEAGQAWPRPVPDDLRAGLGAAQFAAALIEVRRLIGLESGPRRTITDRRLDPVEQALLRDVPPHH